MRSRMLQTLVRLGQTRRAERFRAFAALPMPHLDEFVGELNASALLDIG